MICYEEFDTHTIYPVVMPCGHTYVCCICASKIDKCIECRTSLFKDIPISNPQNDLENDAVGYRSFTVNRSGRRPSRSFDKRSVSHGSPRSLTTAVKERIPLPKNVVLMSLIESSQLVQDTAHNQIITKGLAHYSLQGQGPGQEQGPGPEHLPVDDDDREEDRIGIGADFANAACGTYAVKCKQGLKIVPKRLLDHAAQETSRSRNSSRPRTRSCSRSRSPFRGGSQIDTFSLLDVEDDFDEDKTMGTHSSHTHTQSNTSKLSPTDDSWKRNVEEIVVDNVKKNFFNHADEIMLGYGDRVQVVSIVDNWAKLARGYGYVYLAQESDLVKVGGTLDKAASIEAMISSLSLCRNKLLEAKVDAERDAIALLKELQTTLIQEEDVTVIGAEAFAQDQQDDGQDRGGASSDSGEGTPGDDDNDDYSITAHQIYHSRSGSILQPRIRPRISSSIPADPSLSFLNCDVFAGLQSIVSGDAVQDSMPTNDACDDGGVARANSSTALTMYSSDEMVQAAQVWRKRNGKEASEYTHIDFRTGLSGHTGVRSSQVHDHQQPKHSKQRGRKLRMSAHGGLTPRPLRRKSVSSSSYLSFASFSSFG